MDKKQIALVVAENIKLQMVINDMTPKKLAAITDIELTQLRKYLNGNFVMGLDKFVIIYNALQCSPLELLRGCTLEFIDGQTELFERFKPNVKEAKD